MCLNKRNYILVAKINLWLNNLATKQFKTEILLKTKLFDSFDLFEAFNIILSWSYLSLMNHLLCLRSTMEGEGWRGNFALGATSVFQVEVTSRFSHKRNGNFNTFLIRTIRSIMRSTTCSFHCHHWIVFSNMAMRRELDLVLISSFAETHITLNCWNVAYGIRRS